MDRIFDKVLRLPGEETKSLRGDAPRQELADGDRGGEVLTWSSPVQWGICTNKRRCWGIYKII